MTDWVISKQIYFLHLVTIFYTKILSEKISHKMGMLHCLVTNKLTNAHNAFESEKCHLNSIAGVKISKKDKEFQSKSTTQKIPKRKCKCGTIPLIVSGLMLLTMGLLLANFTITDMVLTEKMKMRPWFPPYGFWLDPEPEVRLNVYIFAAENANEFLSGRDSKIKMKEIGPIAYREYVQHQDVVHHYNSTFSYTAFRWIEFLPHANRLGILNETITVPNFAVLAAASFVNDHNYFIQIGYNFLHRRYNDGLFINITVYDYLWNYRSKLLEKARELAPTMIPISNHGPLHVIYANKGDRYNVKIGTKYGDSQFFQINTINGAATVPGYNVEKGDCYASVENSSEGLMYRQRITKDAVLTVWKKPLCRKVDLYFEKEIRAQGILSYKYTLGPDTYDRKPNNETDCYRGAYGELPDGLTDVSKCFFEMTLAESQPHFYGRSERFRKKIEGLNASEENHSSFAIVEPKLGIPMKQAARSQINLVIPKFSSFFEKDYQKFSDMILPMLWLEFLQKDLTPDLLSFVGLVADVLPILEPTLTCTLFLVGFALIFVVLVKSFNSKWKSLTKSKQMNFQIVQRRSKAGGNCYTFE